MDAVHERIRHILSDESFEAQVRRWLIPRAELAMHLPVAIGDYVDFYSSEHHATNLGRILRPGTPPLLPNWRHLPVGYHGRAGTVVVSGTDIVRPHGLVTTGDGPPRYEPTRMLDIELEVGAIVGVGSDLGRPIPIDRVADHLFGLVLLNDWSARDIQAYEYQPLGPHLGKSFATSISPWVVPFAALQPFLVDGPPQDPAPAAYLTTDEPWGLDLRLRVEMSSATMRAQALLPSRCRRSNFSTMYWTVAQQLAHLTANGASTRPGDLFGSGTVSGPTPGSEGSLIEMTERGRRTAHAPERRTPRIPRRRRRDHVPRRVRERDAADRLRRGARQDRPGDLTGWSHDNLRGLTMPFYRRVGEVPAKRHTLAGPADQPHAEELMGLNGFSSSSAAALPPRFTECDRRHRVGRRPTHRRGPVRPARSPLVPRHLRTADVPAGTDLVTGRHVLLANGDVTVAVARAGATSPLYRTALGDELTFVQSGRRGSRRRSGRSTWRPATTSSCPRRRPTGG